MEEKNMVESPSVNDAVGQATVFAFAPEETAVDTQIVPEETETPAQADSVGDGEQNGEVETVAAEESAQDVNDPETPKTQKDINYAIGREKERIRKQAEDEYNNRFETDEVYLIGKMMVEDMMNQEEGLTKEEATKKVRDNFVKAMAQRDGISPAVARKLYGTEPRQKVESMEERASRIAREVQQAPKPDGFDEKAAYNDEAFLTLLEEYPASAAIRIYTAEQKTANAKQDLAEKLRARQSIPQSIKPQAPVTPKTDWMNVSTEDFLKEKARRNKIVR